MALFRSDYIALSKPNLTGCASSHGDSYQRIDRTKEQDSHGEPLYLDVLRALYSQRANSIRHSRGRYGLSGKAFHPEDVEAIYTMMQAPEQEQMHEFVVVLKMT
ncbi:hypothetical protein HND97_17255 [Vibrio cholerae]|nr:hypothetical protein HND97_17255 [Vibrio cholerae]